MTDVETPTTVLTNWAALLGSNPILGDQQPGRELWPVTAQDRRDYFLKRLGPWRNLPVASEARVLHWLSRHGTQVPEFQVTDRATLVAGEPEDSYVLLPRLPADQLTPAEVVAVERTVGRSIALLHRNLAAYPWPVDSYTEQLGQTVRSELLLPPDLAAAFTEHRTDTAAAIDRLPVQLIHGDLTPDNILLRRPAQVSGFIDFDHLPLAPRIWDLAKYLSRRLRQRWRTAPAAGGIRLDSVEPVVRGYHDTAPLSTPELDALPRLIAAANLIEASYGQRISSGLLQRRMLPDHDDTLADAIETAQWHLANADAVRDAARSAVL